MVGQPKVAPKEAKTEVPAGVAVEVVVKTEVSERKVVLEEVMMARAYAPVILTSWSRKVVMSVTVVPKGK